MQGVVFSGTGRNSEALAAYHHALNISPDYLPALEGVAQVEYEGGGEDVIPMLQHILKLRPDNPTSHAMLGGLAYKQGDCSGTVGHFGVSWARRSSHIPIRISKPLRARQTLTTNSAFTLPVHCSDQKANFNPSCITRGAIGPIEVICPTLLVDGSLSGIPKSG